MDRPDAGPGKRPFRPVSVGNCYAQTANDRFGSGASEAVRARERSDSQFFSGQDGTALDWDESCPDNGVETSIYRLVPTMQRYRNNLTALSQLYNLYLVAYQGQIFVYVPRSVPKQTIPRLPDLHLAPRPTEASRHMGGYQDPSNPHTINHIMVGALGTEEAVVACYDDGDVVAYFTSEIADWIASRPCVVPIDFPRVQNGARPRSSMPRPFLEENVGKSAWGLALHKKSRLVAVSSNRCEVTVFALSLAPRKGGGLEPDSCECCRPDCGHVESHVRQRARNWRIVVALGRMADNIPNLCFVDDDQGLADMICAIDIRGAIWLADIWRPSQAATRVEPCNCIQLRNSDSWPALSRGWGIVALPRSSFLKVDSVEELLGASGRELDVLPNATLNMESHLQDVPDNPCSIERRAAFPDRLPLGAGTDQVLNAVFVQHLDVDESQQSDSDWLSEEAEVMEGMEIDIEVEVDGLAGAVDGVSDIAAMLANTVETGGETLAMTVQQLVAQSLPAHVIPAANVSHPPTASGGDAKPLPASDGPTAKAQGEREQGQDLLDMMYLPHEGRVFPMPQKTLGLVEFLKAETRSNGNDAGEDSVLDRLAKRYHVLRLHEKEMELRSLDQGAKGTARESGILCPQAMNMGQALMSPATRLLFRATSRLSMVVHVPELSLVVVGSPIGRVLLVTPTRLPRPVTRAQGQLQHGMRVDWVLPRRSDEMRYRRVARPLHGMAVGPVQETGDGAGVGGSGPRRYRLMLHYRNHDVLTYELTREEETGKVCIF